MPVAPLAVASLMVLVTIVIQIAGLTLLILLMRARLDHERAHRYIINQLGMVLGVALGLFLIHTIQIWLYALVFMWVGAFDSFEPALYFSTSSFTTVGYGDIVLETDWRLLGAIESANGFLVLGWSTVFLISVISRLRSIEFQWLERREAEADLFEAQQARDDADEDPGRNGDA